MFPLKEESRVKVENPPTLTFSPIPTPPATISAPLVIFVEVLAEVIDTELKETLEAKLVIPPIVNPPLIIAFPFTSNVATGAIFPIPTNPPVVFNPNEFDPVSSAEFIYPASQFTSYPAIILALFTFGTDNSNPWV